METTGERRAESDTRNQQAGNDLNEQDTRGGPETRGGQDTRRELGQPRGGTERSDRVSIAEAMRLASGQLAELLQCEPGSVSAVKPAGEGWTADVEVVEVERVPETTSVMGSYRVQLDGQGNLLGYERTRRYARGQIDRST